MKTILFTVVVSAVVAFAYGQNPSMTVAHTGLSPYDTLTVYVGDSIDFFYGSGGNHPMTEGWQSGEASTPIPFATQTVSSSMASVTFTLDTPGTYYFHCGTNPGNSDNWGKITVLDTTSAPPPTGIQESETTEYKIYPNPVADVLTIEGFDGDAVIVNVNGKILQVISESSTDISSLPSGIYFIQSKEVITKFIKK